MEKEFFLPGDIVTIRQDLTNKPIMLVLKKVMKTVTVLKTKSNQFQGILCRWFTTDGTLQESIFNTKDLKKIKK